MNHLYKIIPLFLFLAVAAAQAGYAYSDTIVVHINTTVCGQLKWNDTLLLESGDYGYLYTDGDAIFVDSLHLTVNPLPIPSIIGETIVCDGQTTTLTATGGIQYQWSSAVSDTNASITVGQGKYSVTVTDANGCSNTSYVRVTMLPQFLAGRIMSGDMTLCEGNMGAVLIGNSVSASGGDGHISYRWKCNNMVIFGICDTLTVTVDTLPVGTYLFTREAKDDACNIGWSASEGVFVITVEALPDVQIIPSAETICRGDSAILTATGGHRYLWSTDEETPQITVGESGSYTVSGSSSNGCAASVSVLITVNDLPNVTLSGDSAFCQGGSNILTAEGANTYNWNTGGNTATINVNNAGCYSVTGTDTNGCVNSATMNVTLYPLPNVTISGENSFCEGSNTALTASGASTYVWSNGATDSTTTVSTEGTYTVTGTDDNGCFSTVSKTVSLNPSYNIYVYDTICAGESYHFFGQRLDTAGIYPYRLFTSKGCDSVITLTLTVNPLPDVTIAGDSAFCQGYSTTLTASGASIYTWDNGMDGSEITVTSAGTYTVTGRDTSGCANSATHTVTVMLPVVGLVETTACEFYEWNDSIYTTSGSYAQTFPAANGCDSIVTLLLTINPSTLERKDIVCKKDKNGIPYMLVYPYAGLLYQWYQDEVAIEGETKQYYAPKEGLQAGSCYTVRVAPTEPDACGVVTACWTGASPQTAKVRILPNPNNGQFRLMLPEGTVSVQILNANGQTVLVHKADGAETVEMNTGLANGLYIVKTFRKDGSFDTEKIIINR